MRFILRGFFGLFVLALTAAALGVGGYTLMQARSEGGGGGGWPRGGGGGERAIPAVIAVIENGDAFPVIQTYGEIESARTLELRAGIGGVVTRLADNFRNGAAVAEGELLFEIDPLDAEAALIRAETEQLEAEANLRDARAGLALGQDELTAAEGQRALREAALERQRDLEGRGVGTSAATEQAELSFSQAEQTVLARRQAILSSESAISRAEIALARAELAVTEAQRDLDETRTVAPFSGRLSSVSAVQGRRINANEQLAVLVDPDALEVAFQVTNAQYARLLNARGELQPLEIGLSLDLDGIPFETTGVIERSDAVVGEGTTGRRIFARLAEGGADLFRPGDFVEVRIVEPMLTDVATVPATAVSGDGRMLIAGEENRLRAIDVRIARRQGDDVIVAGARTGMRYVVELRPQLGAGVLIDPIEQPRDGGAMDVQAEVMITLDPDRRQRLIAFVEANNRMPEAARARVISQLEEEEVPESVVTRLEGRMGG
ncbi:efflux RND transporter periplasmic adaptor subunit [Pontivivens insulae]|uniref:Multidrug resistance protein MdtA n=1 Tax=Pontivivens insulae TaxID=1639689 RepID=A0A2R8A7B8_9RHOB|nr:HlyD family efflux transporter periplasmic adaptor subunit [Pontivivens insulae]RED18194.1 HlyD family secretion protein [Pontivivens insulae]SPF28092.1 Multidrug resistance protein MdtA [Pontivivens insulae]